MIEWWPSGGNPGRSPCVSFSALASPGGGIRRQTGS
jgi:hypothetical protein